MRLGYSGCRPGSQDGRPVDVFDAPRVEIVKLEWLDDPTVTRSCWKLTSTPSRRRSGREIEQDFSSSCSCVKYADRFEDVVMAKRVVHVEKGSPCPPSAQEFVKRFAFERVFAQAADDPIIIDAR